MKSILGFIEEDNKNNNKFADKSSWNMKEMSVPKSELNGRQNKLKKLRM